MNIRSFAVLSVSSALLLTSCATTHKEPRLKVGKGMGGEVVVAEGTAPYQADNLPASRAAALAAAQRQAVELVVGVYVSARTRVDKAVAIENNILSKTEGYVKRYEIISEGRDGQWYKMKIRALVLTDSLRGDLNSLGVLRQPGVGNPRVAVLLQEYVGEKQSTEGYATHALTQVLLNQGFKVVALPNSVNPQDDPVEVAKAVSHNTAEILLAGLARAQSMGMNKKLGGMASYRASISFRVIETGTGQVLSTVSETASGMEATPELASQKALQEAASLTSKDLATLPAELAKQAHVDLTINGITSFEELGKFRKGLSTLHGVKDEFLRSFTQETAIAIFDVMTDQISPQDLADECTRIGGPAWTVISISGHSVQLSASAAGR